jgi:hypothetical protein
MHDIIAVDGRLAFPPLYDLLRSAQKRVQPSALQYLVSALSSDFPRVLSTAED